MLRAIPSRTTKSISLPVAVTQTCRASRSYATAGSRTPKTLSTTTTKKPAAKTSTSKATPTTSTKAIPKSSSKTSPKTSRTAPNAPAEEESIASRTPLKKPSTSGLGVPSKSPSAAPKANPPKTANTRKYVLEKQPSALYPETGEAAQEAARREAQLREARIRREEEETEEEKERAYQERYNSAKYRYVGSMIGLPIAIVTSWHLWNRFAADKQAEEVHQLKDDKLLELSK